MTSARPAPETDELVVDSGDGVLSLRLNRPDTFNALTEAMVLGLLENLREAHVRDDVRVVVITGTGPAFSAGADLSGENPEEKYDARSVEAASMLIRAVTDLDQPVVCGLNGIAAGVGASLVLACDLVVATGSAGFTLGFSKIGLMPDGGATATLAASIGRMRAMRLALLSDLLGAQEAYDAGLVSHLFSDEDYPDGLRKVVSRLAAAAPLATAATKKAVNAATLAHLPAAFDHEHLGQSLLLRTEDVKEGMQAFNDRRRPDFRGR